MRAMEARLTALHEEQIMAFTRANAAGFDDKSIVDLMNFAENFGAQRLKYVKSFGCIRSFPFPFFAVRCLY